MYQAGLFRIGLPASVVPIENGKTQTNVPYVCPSQASNCTVKGILNCADSNTEQKVVFRTNGVWIAWDGDNDGDLDCYSVKSNPSPNCNLKIKNTITLPNTITTYGGMKFYGNSETIFTKKTEISFNYCANLRLLSGTECSLDPIPLSQYSGNEIYSGMQDAFTCSGLFKITDKTGKILNQETIQYSSSSTWSRSSGTYTIGTGDKASITGGSSNYVEYNSYFISECNFNECNSAKTGYYTCTNGRKGTILTPCSAGEECTGGISSNARCTVVPTCSVNYCNNELTAVIPCVNGKDGSPNLCDTQNGWFCKVQSSVAQCVPPFIKSELSTSKPGYNMNENIIVNVNVYSQESTINTGNVRVYLFNAPGAKIPINTFFLNNYNFKANLNVPLTIPNPGVSGTYYLTMDAMYNSKTVPFSIKPSFKISPEVTCAVNIKGETRPTPYVNNGVIVEVVTSMQVDRIVFDALKYNNVVITNIPTPTLTQSQDRAFYIYSYKFLFTQSGLFEASAHAELADVSSLPSSQSIQVKDLYISALFTNLPECVKLGDTKTFYFETKVLDNYENTNNYLGITNPEQVSETDISSLVTPVSTGKYSFTYTYSKLGAYDLNLISTSTEYNVGSNPIPGQIEVLANCDSEGCTSVDDCKANQICSNNKCVDQGFDWTYLLIGGIVLVAFVIVIVVILSRRKKRPDIMGGF